MNTSESCKSPTVTSQIMNLVKQPLLVVLGFIVLIQSNVTAQDHLKAMPGYQQFHTMSLQLTNAAKLGSVSVSWKDEGNAFEYQWGGKRYRYDIASGTATELKKPSTDAPRDPPRGRRPGRSSGPERGRQFASATSPDGKLKALYRDNNLWMTDVDGTNEFAITTDGNEKSRIKYGTASWVYGEELDQSTAIWWSTNSTKLAYYRFDESKVHDFYLQLNQTKIQDTLNTEAYPKAGAPNPIVDLFIYDVETKKSIQVDVRDGKPFDDSVVGHYAYHVAWSPDGKQLLFNRTNRRQNILEFCACDPETGKCHVILREEWLPSWTDNNPAMRFLKDGHRFIWTSERTGWRNFYLYDLDGTFLGPLTSHTFEVEDIEQVDEDAGQFYYMAHDGDNPMKLQLHRAGLNGQGDVRLTDPAFNHTVNIAPDHRHFIDVAQTHDSPPVTRLMDASGKPLHDLAKSDTTNYTRLHLKPVELFKFKAADGETDLYGMLHFPSNFKPGKKYPLIVSVYAGPDTTGARETFTMPNVLTEFGFLVATFDSRSASGRGKRFTDAIYFKLGQPEIDDQAAGVKSLWHRSYLNKDRVGIFGVSYGGYVSAMAILRHPDVFSAASASSPPTDWHLYDSIYTERYMWIPQENKQGYDIGSAMTYADKLKGHLLLYYGTADNNVHPSNSLQLIRALQQAGKSFEVQVGPDQGHSAVSRDRMMEFFIENLVLHQSSPL
ncbi:MAG: ptpA 7 [Pedosphaera sp.]|nr:ptpA 7 [Pedosphaera sp.]